MGATQIRGKQILDNDITSDDIGDGAVRGATGNGGTQQEIATGTVSDVDIRNSAITPLKIDSTQSFSMSGLTLSNTSNQLVLGTTRTVTLTAPTPATSSRTWTIPDISGNGTFAALEGTQTISGAKTFTAATAITLGSSTLPLNITRSGAGQVLQLTNTGGTVDIEFFPSSASKWRLGHGVATGGFDLKDTVNNRTSLTVDSTTSAVSILGTNTNNSASAGYVGEYVESAVTNIAAPTSGQYGDLTSISLTAGDWLISGLVASVLNGSTITTVAMGVSTHTGNDSTGLITGDTTSDIVNPTSNTNPSASIPYKRFSLSTTTTIYLKMFANYTGATPKFYGRLSASRVR